MRERPILFGSPMVQAILAGTKTQTRRVIKPHPDSRPAADFVGGVWHEEDEFGDSHPIRCPYGQPGDRLWVRETWARVPRTAYAPPLTKPDPHDTDMSALYRAGFDRSDGGIRWRPSIHMPRWAARLTLEVLRVWAERVQDITEEGARAEGVEPVMVDTGGQQPWGEWINQPDYIAPFMDLWDDINDKRGFGWHKNPWVWVVEFKRVEEG